MNEAEIERLMVTLVGDISGFEDEFKRAVDLTIEAGRQMQDAIDNSAASVVAAGQLMADAIEWAGAKFLALGKSAVDGFAEAELAETKLRSAIGSHGGDVEGLTKDYQNFAAQMQRVTVAEDDAVISMLAQAEAMGLSGDAAKRAVKNTLAAQASGLPANLRMMAQLEEGHIGRLGTLLPALKNVKGETEKVAKAQELLGNMFGAAEAEAGTFSGAMKRLHVSFGNSLEVIGKVVAEAIKPLVVWLKDASDWFQTLSPEVIKVISIIGGVTAAVAMLIGAWGPLVAIVGPGLAAAATLIGALVSPIGLVIAAVVGLTAYLVGSGSLSGVWDTVSTAVMEFATNAFGFLVNFRENVGIITEWIKNNWREILMNIGQAIGVFVGNSIANFVVMQETTIRLFTVFQGWAIGMFQRVFSVEFVLAVWEGIKEAFNLYQGFLRNLADGIKKALTGALEGGDIFGGFIAQMEKDLKRGAKSVNPLEAIKNVLGEQAGKLRGPLEGFESTLAGPELNLEFKGIGEDAGSEFALGTAAGIESKKHEIHKAAQKAMENATQFGSAESMRRISAFQDITGGGGLMRLSSKSNAGAQGMPKAESDAAKERKEMTDTLKSIDRAVTKIASGEPLVMSTEGLE